MAQPEKQVQQVEQPAPVQEQPQVEGLSQVEQPQSSEVAQQASNGVDGEDQGEGEKARERGGEFEPNIVFVGNLDYKTTWQKLKDVFRRAGPVRFADLIADSDGRPKGSALVTFENEVGANAAIKMFHDDDFDGRRILCRRFEVGRRPAFVRHQNQPRDRKFVPGVSQQLGMGGPQGIRPQQPGMGVPQGPGVPQQQQQQMGPNGTYEDVPRPRSQQHRSDGKLFVSNLPFECTSQSLRDTFGQVGHVLDAAIIHSANGRSRGMGLVEFASRREAEVAIQEFDGIQMAGRPMQVRFERSVTQQ